MASFEETKLDVEAEMEKNEAPGGGVEFEENDGKFESVDIENSTKEGKIRTQESGGVVDTPWSTRMWEVFTTFWPLGFVAFGGPQAHVAILRDHLVVQRDWMDEEQFTELFAIGQGTTCWMEWVCLFVFSVLELIT